MLVTFHKFKDLKIISRNKFEIRIFINFDELNIYNCLLLVIKEYRNLVHKKSSLVSKKSAKVDILLK